MKVDKTTLARMAKGRYCWSKQQVLRSIPSDVCHILLVPIRSQADTTMSLLYLKGPPKTNKKANKQQK